MQGKFITFEGGEGSGKTTQIALLEGYLKKEGYSYISGREPGKTPLAERIRAILLYETSEEIIITPKIETLLFITARADYVEQFVRPSLQQGKIVLSDRFYDSTVVYQGLAKGVDLEMIKTLNRLATDGLTPDLTLVLDVPEEIVARTLAKAIGSSGVTDRLEAENIEFHRKVYAGFRSLAEEEPKRVKLVPYIHGGLKEMHQQILAYVNPLLSKKTT